MPMYEFACKCGQRIERLTVYETASVQCACGGNATRVLSAPAFKLEGWSGDFPTAHSRFERIHTEKLNAERKANS
jgi:putative FmdB family regulatory protein